MYIQILRCFPYRLRSHMELPDSPFCRDSQSILRFQQGDFPSIRQIWRYSYPKYFHLHLCTCLVCLIWHLFDNSLTYISFRAFAAFDNFFISRFQDDNSSSGRIALFSELFLQLLKIGFVNFSVSLDGLSKKLGLSSQNVVIDLHVFQIYKQTNMNHNKKNLLVSR